ncbi:periplasmic serine protease DO; heat shock protein HtrA [Campylobacter lari]|uniref:Periplasmic heat shock serine protease HtrA, Do family n=1 Tax=Campylobacter lari NCTC 11845 TaxID=1388749 RepID=A0A0A8HWC6_CAMLA|nr:periplasmic heat shock serine protease HtrA, Do family [Campylobacter lari]AJD01741.1 periplasmic heat shock serine protease HtrA, Do family [Campylobacter lari NCTC 11845]EAK0847445.1 periplasmic heat shock serine protease HtrA, Do family [Campylobacter lari]EAK0979928.1 periplasmic heat shock serine protease HtrA, Do family [Campylobacter lari]EAK9954512.1 periplasmic heat shock serine protease HtrA, Do family [Campylobacter lari]MCR6542446.1 periplasmic heat shock serine protease HtrA, D
MKKTLVLSVALATTLFGTSIDFKQADNNTQRSLPTDNQNTILSYHDSIQKVKSSVVNISTSKTVQSNSFGIDDFFNDPYFKQFFGFDFPQAPKNKKNKKEVVSSLGSGVIISSDGYIITNNHVIEGAEKITVNLPDSSTEYKAKLIGADPKTDLAVIKIEAKNLPAVVFADSDKLLEGDVVFALGNPFGVGSSVTSGIISALNKNNIGLNQYENFIQTDASINPGNSGGALVDSRGALVGINSAILSRSGGNNGIGFAIPSNMAKSIAQKLIEHGKIERGYLGVVIGALTQDIKKAYTNQEGALITEVQKDSAAYNAGLKRGDLIIKVDKTVIKSPMDLKNYIGSIDPKQAIEVTYERDNKVKTAKFMLKTDEKSLQYEKGYIDGLKLVELNSKNKQQYRIPENISGILITEVTPKSKAEKIGFEQGDIIIGIDQYEVLNFKELSKALELNKGKEYVKIWINRGGMVRALLF